MKLATRLLIFALGIGLVVLVPGFMAVNERLREMMVENRSGALEREAKLIADHLSIDDRPQELAARSAATLGGRVTIIDNAGIVRGDASVGVPRAQPVGRAAVRPEVRAVRRGHTRVAVEQDSGGEALYVAVGSPQGIVRVGVATVSLSGVFEEARRDIVIVFFAIVLMAALFAMLYARYLSKPVIQLRDMARALSRNDFSESPPVGAPGEVGDLAESLTHLSARLQALALVRQDFIANVSHELCSPLAIASGFAATLARHDPPPEQRRKFAHAILSNTNRIQRVIDDMLDLSRIESGSWIPRIEQVSIPDVASEVLDSLRPAAEEKGVALSTDFDPSATLVDADRTAVRQTLANLSENSLRHTASGAITIFSERTPDGLWLGVRDTGEGIDAASLPRIFERLYRVDEGRARNHGGSGLGLAIVKHMAEAHGGRVHAESEPGVSTSIRAFFPQPVGTPRPPTPAHGINRVTDEALSAARS